MLVPSPHPHYHATLPTTAFVTRVVNKANEITAAEALQTNNPLYKHSGALQPQSDGNTLCDTYHTLAAVTSRQISKMVYNFKVFKKCAPNGKITLYMAKRDFIDHISTVEPIGQFKTYSDCWISNRLCLQKIHSSSAEPELRAKLCYVSSGATESIILVFNSNSLRRNIPGRHFWVATLYGSLEHLHLRLQWLALVSLAIQASWPENCSVVEVLIALTQYRTSYLVSVIY